MENEAQVKRIMSERGLMPAVDSLVAECGYSKQQAMADVWMLADSEPTRCWKCGNVIDDDPAEQFCPHCGADVVPF